MGKTKLCLIAFLTVTIQGCATLSESECETADWRIIGLEDGAAGKPLSQVGRHRKACAEYGVRPDIARYERGHADGVRQYCVPRTGFELGKRGRGHNNVCPADLREAFRAAYDDGRRVHAAQIEAREAQQRVRAAYSDLDGIAEAVAALEARLVSGGGTSLERKNWIDQLKLLESERERLQADIHALEHEASDRENQYQSIVSKFTY